MAYISQREAARLCGRSRNTLRAAIEAGTLSATAEGIDPAELARVFPFKLPGSAAPPSDPPPEPPGPAPEPARSSADHDRIDALERENQQLRERLYGMADRAFDLAEQTQRIARDTQVESQRQIQNEIETLRRIQPEPPRSLPAPRGFLDRLLGQRE